MTGFDDFLIEHVYSLRHWPFFAAAVVFMSIGEVLKRSVWTKERARARGSLRWLWYTGRVTLPIHPVCAGFFVGLIWDEPERYVSGPAACFYFAAAGALSVWLYQIIKSVLRRRGLSVGNVYFEPADFADLSDPVVTPVERPSSPPGARPDRPTIPYDRK